MKKVRVKTIKEEYHICDECNKNLARNSCPNCPKDLCSDCGMIDYANSDDYPDYYCKQCWEFRKPFFKKIKEHEEAIDKLMVDWETKCKKKAKKINEKENITGSK